MTTYREAIYMCVDLLKGMSDDFSYTEDHIAYLIDKFRALLLKQRYGNDPKKHVPYSNYQSIIVDFTPTKHNNLILKSNSKVPYMLQLGIPRVVTEDTDYYNFRFELTSRERLPFVNNNKYTLKFYYCAINEEGNVLLRSHQEDWRENEYFGPTKFNLVGIFENPREITDEISFGENEITLNEWDRNIPIEEGLVTTLIELVVKELAGSVYRPNDEVNNNRDDNADMANYIRSNMKSNMAKQLQ